ncbi:MULTISPECIES: hypothetical protein [Rhodococcoides]|uniref:hypothetical protein n=1 Tax=Rhodococcoides TaxID=3259750 RepID=UPI00082FFCB4|nr:MULTISPECIES: hypothetical protein [Rhodococcus]MBY6436367.1 hypothetical protein [Rhodococcus kroppenstedtii]
MKLNRMAAVAAMTIVALGGASATAYANPTAPEVHWNAVAAGTGVLVTTDSGTLSTENNHLVVRDAAGVVVDSVPLGLALDGVVHPVSAQVDGNTATLAVDAAAPTTPVYDLPGTVPVDLPAAVAGVKDNIALSASVGGFLGAASGLVGGCLLGATAAGVVSAPVALLFGAGPLAGCIGGAVLLGSGASLAGTAIGGLGAVAGNAQQFVTLLQAPPAPKK